MDNTPRATPSIPPSLASGDNLPKQFCPIRSSIVAELTTATGELANIVDRLKVLAAHKNGVADSNKEFRELNSRRNTITVECGELLQKLGAHRAEHDC
jgi:hypothetical protein